MEKLIFLVSFEKLRSLGFTVEQKPMGSGGVFQVKNIKGSTRVQIGYAHGRHNYAYCVIL